MGFRISSYFESTTLDTRRNALKCLRGEGETTVFFLMSYSIPSLPPQIKYKGKNKKIFRHSIIVITTTTTQTRGCSSFSIMRDEIRKKVRPRVQKKGILEKTSARGNSWKASVL